MIATTTPGRSLVEIVSECKYSLLLDVWRGNDASHENVVLDFNQLVYNSVKSILWGYKNNVNNYSTRIIPTVEEHQTTREVYYE
jgi:hypothetical protein